MVGKKLFIPFFVLLPLVALANERFDVSALDILGLIYFLIVFPIGTLFLYIYPIAKKINRRDNKIILYRLVFNSFTLCCALRPLFVYWKPIRSTSDNIKLVFDQWHRRTTEMNIFYSYLGIVILIDMFIIVLRRAVKRNL